MGISGQEGVGVPDIDNCFPESESTCDDGQEGAFDFAAIAGPEGEGNSEVGESSFGEVEPRLDDNEAVVVAGIEGVKADVLLIGSIEVLIFAILE